MITTLRTRLAASTFKPAFNEIRHLATMPKYPGLGIPLRHFPQEDYGTYPMGTHGNIYGADSDILPVREVAMMIIMDKLTDKPEWNKKVFNGEIVAKWRKEALEYPDDLFWKQAAGGKDMADQDESNQFDYSDQDDVDHNHVEESQLEGIMSNEAFDYCVQELRSKARYYEATGLIPTLDACASVVKSDSLCSPELQTELRYAFDKLKFDQAASPDWHPNSNEMVQDLLHPSMYPLIYGRSRVFEEEVVGVDDAIEKWASKGEVVEKDNFQPGPNERASYNVGGSHIPPNFWSDTYQWLPSNVAFQNDGSVKFTSYINNLHPNKYPGIYRTIERLVERALPAWDQCLALSVGYEKKSGAGRTDSRFSKPIDPDDENPDNWDPPHPRTPKSESPEGSVNEDIDSDEVSEVPKDEYELREEWEEIRRPILSQPDPFKEEANFYSPKEGTRLSEKFKEAGLQIIVKMASIELTPEKPEFPAGGWHVEGQMNERICATAIYYLDSTNITPSTLSFRMQTSAYMNDVYEVGQDAYSWLEQVYGTGFGCGNSPCLQNYGDVETKEGRMLAFPNVFQHRVSPFRLTDPTKPGHRRFIALWLVDPHVRIISTANVPPQQLSWWADSLFSQNPSQHQSGIPTELAQLLREKGLAVGASADGVSRLPPEIMDMLREHVNEEGALLIDEDEARIHREELMRERSAFHGEAEHEWHSATYNFCEH